MDLKTVPFFCPFLFFALWQIDNLKSRNHVRSASLSASKFGNFFVCLLYFFCTRLNYHKYSYASHIHR